MTAISALLLLGVIGICYVGKAIALSGNATVIVHNDTKKKIYARVVDRSSSYGSMDYAVPPDGIKDISFEPVKSYAFFFATGCSEDKAGHLKDCHSGNCADSHCTVENRPLAATMIYYMNGSWTTSTERGYNFGLYGDFQCDKCDCSSISCIIPLNKCPSSTILEDSDGLAIACKAGVGVPSCQDDTTEVSSYSPPAGTSCFDGAVMKIKVSSPTKE